MDLHGLPKSSSYKMWACKNPFQDSVRRAPDWCKSPGWHSETWKRDLSFWHSFFEHSTHFMIDILAFSKPRTKSLKSIGKCLTRNPCADNLRKYRTKHVDLTQKSIDSQVQLQTSGSMILRERSKTQNKKAIWHYCTHTHAYYFGPAILQEETRTKNTETKTKQWKIHRKQHQEQENNRKQSNKGRASSSKNLNNKLHQQRRTKIKPHCLTILKQIQVESKKTTSFCQVTFWLPKWTPWKGHLKHPKRSLGRIWKHY